MAQQIIYGTVTNREVYSGNGFQVLGKSETGIYQITFNNYFKEIPAITATVQVPLGFPDAVGINVIIAPDEQQACQQVEFQIRDTHSKDLEDHPFSFVVVGQSKST